MTKPQQQQHQYRFRGQVPPVRREPVRAEVTASTNGSVATLRIYDVIDSWGDVWGISAKEVAEALDALGPNVREIDLRLNSPGGEATEGVAILNVLRAHPARVVATVDGLAASAASFLACGADETIMARNSQVMIHDAWGLVIGNADDMRHYAGVLDKLSDNIASIYAAKASGTVEQWRTAMRAESWYNADEAVTAGLADRVLDAEAPPAQDRFDLTVFAHAGREAAPDPLVPARDEKSENAPEPAADQAAKVPASAATLARARADAVSVLA